MSSQPQALAERVALVTGGSSGIGAATARLLAAQGATVVVAYNAGAGRAAALVEALPGAGHASVRIALEDLATIEQAAEFVESRFSKLDVLVNCAGFTQPIPHRDVQTLDDALFRSILVGNTCGTYSVIRAMLPLLQASQSAVVVNVSSIAAFTGSGSNVAYCAAKAAIDTMTMSLARAFGPKVRFLCISPGAVATDFVAGRDPAALAAVVARTPMQRLLQPDDVADAVLACVTHLKMATGNRIIVDGGQHL